MDDRCTTEESLREASPVQYVTAEAPPLLCTHSTNDTLVPIEHGRRILQRYREAGAGRAELYDYAGPGEQHGIWIEGSDPHRLLPHLEKTIAEFLEST